MARLESLKTPFTQLSDSERMDLVMAIRFNRRISKRPPPVERTRKTSSATKKPKLSVSDLNPTDAARLLEQLEAMLESED